MDFLLEQIPAGGRYYLTIDADGLDPSVMPAVAGPAAGGLFFHQVRRLIHGLAQKGTLLGIDIVEITPARDLNGISAITAGQLILNFIGAIVRNGQLA
jgi:agmatinase